MKIVRTVTELRVAIARQRYLGHQIGLVPTMGAFHQGHLSLMKAARRENEFVVVSLFVNPTQFAPQEDLSAYPRDEAADAAMAAAQGVDLLFAPTAQEIYPDGYATAVQVGRVSEVLCGAHRGIEHFQGVATVVSKLFNMVTPDIAYFGQKDAQQVLVIKQLVRDLNFNIEIKVCPTVREADGLAMSSRNAYLAPAERQRATVIHRALEAATALVAQGTTDEQRVLDAARSVLETAGIEFEYLELRDAEDLSPVREITGPTLMAVAARIGRARLIDNTVLDNTVVDARSLSSPSRMRSVIADEILESAAIVESDVTSDSGLVLGTGGNRS